MASAAVGEAWWQPRQLSWVWHVAQRAASFLAGSPGRLELGRDRQRSRVRFQRLDGLHLGRVHVALGAEVARVAGGARGGDGAFAGPGLLAMALLDEPR
jgi:hypothetical protein